MAVKARKGDMTTTFTDMIWRNMGKNKNGWTAITESDFSGVQADLKAAQANTGISYKDLVARAKGLETDGVLDKALELFKQAYAVKQTKALATKIGKMEEVLETQAKVEQAQPLVEAAKQMADNEDYATAIEFLGQAAAIIDTAEIQELVELYTGKIES